MNETKDRTTSALHSVSASLSRVSELKLICEMASTLPEDKRAEITDRLASAASFRIRVLAIAQLLGYGGLGPIVFFIGRGLGRW